MVLTNPSGVPQEVQMDFIASGGITIARDLGMSCGSGAICADTTHCQNDVGLKSIAQNENLCIGVRINGGGLATTGPRAGVSVKIKINGGKGF